MRHRIIEHLQKDEKPATSATKRHQSSWPSALALPPCLIGQLLEDHNLQRCLGSPWEPTKAGAPPTAVAPAWLGDIHGCCCHCCKQYEAKSLNGSLESLETSMSFFGAGNIY